MKTLAIQIAVIIGLSLAAAVISAFLHPKRPPWFVVSDPVSEQWKISVEEAVRLVGENESVLWIDARDREKYDAGHVEGAILLNTDEWGELMFRNLNRLQASVNEPVIVYCDGTGCEKSEEVAQRLRELIGLDPVYVLEGDWTIIE